VTGSDQQGRGAFGPPPLADQLAGWQQAGLRERIALQSFMRPGDTEAAHVWQRMERVNAVQGIIDRTFISPMVVGHAWNPFNFGQTLTSAVQINRDFRDQFMQTQAFMGRGSVDNTRLQGFTNQLNDIGVTKGETLTNMRLMAEITGRIAENLDESVVAMQSFARAAGLEGQQVVQMLGSIAQGTNLLQTGGDQQQFFRNVTQMARGNNALIRPISSLINMFTEVSRQSGATAGMLGGEYAGTFAGEQMASQMLNLNRTLYEPRPDLAFKHAMQVVGPASRGSLMLPFAMAANRQSGRSTDLLDVMADSAEQLPHINEYLLDQVGGNRGLATYMAFTGQMDAGFARRLRNGGTAASRRHRPDGSQVPEGFRSAEEIQGRASSATSERQKATATYVNDQQTTEGVFAGAVEAFDTAVKTFSKAAVLTSMVAGGGALTAWRSGSNMKRMLDAMRGASGPPGGVAGGAIAKSSRAAARAGIAAARGGSAASVATSVAAGAVGAKAGGAKAAGGFALRRLAGPALIALAAAPLATAATGVAVAAGTAAVAYGSYKGVQYLNRSYKAAKEREEKEWSAEQRTQFEEREHDAWVKREQAKQAEEAARRDSIGPTSSLFPSPAPAPGASASDFSLAISSLQGVAANLGSLSFRQQSSSLRLSGRRVDTMWLA
jgi:hypothetical protein